MLEHILIIITSVFLALGGLGIYRESVTVLGLLFAIAMLGIKLLQQGRITFPKKFFVFLVFLAMYFIHTQIFSGNTMLFWFFVSGAGWWLAVFNYKKLFSEYFVSILYIVGILMAALFVISKYISLDVSGLVTLFTPANIITKHSEIGDLWAIIIVATYPGLSGKNAAWKWIPMFLGIYFLMASYSRSALISVLSGILYITSKNKSFEVKRYLPTFLVTVAAIFIFVSFSKSILVARPYFIEAILGLIKYPFGTGVGNFELVSNTANIVHNIFLEFISGMGIFSIIVIYFFYRVLLDLFNKSKVNVTAAAVFLAILANFSFNSTYLIPSFIWIWFMALALI